MSKRIIPFVMLFGILTISFLAIAEEGMLNPEVLQIEEHYLDNGLQVLLLEDHSAPVISYQVWVHTGSRNERPGITGISHMFEHMMFRGSKNMVPKNIRTW